MSSTITLTWRGNEVLEKIDARVKEGMQKTLAQTVAFAHQPNVTPRDTSNLVNSITMSEVYGSSAAVYVGFVGSFGNVPYALYVEVGTYKMAGRHYMKRSGDAIFPNLIQNIGVID